MTTKTAPGLDPLAAANAAASQARDFEAQLARRRAELQQLRLRVGAGLADQGEIKLAEERLAALEAEAYDAGVAEYQAEKARQRAALAPIAREYEQAAKRMSAALAEVAAMNEAMTRLYGDGRRISVLVEAWPRPLASLHAGALGGLWAGPDLQNMPYPPRLVAPELAFLIGTYERAEAGLV